MIKQLQQFGFTLAELLIALAILGVIATFTIPKILDSGTDNKNKAMALETAATAAEAFQHLKKDGLLSASTNSGDLTPYINYVRPITTGENIQVPWGSFACDDNRPCYELHNGGWLRLYSHPQREFGGTSTTNLISMVFDPDGDQPTIGVQFQIFYNGRLTSSNLLEGPWADSDSTGTGPNGTAPSWFSWSN